MATIDDIMTRISPAHLAQEVESKHNQIRLRYRLQENVAHDFDEYYTIIGDYYAHHSHRAFGGGQLPRHQAIQEARRIIEREYERRGRTILNAYEDAHAEREGGLMAQLDLIATDLKRRETNAYVRQVFDDFVKPNSKAEKVELIRQFMQRVGPYLSTPFRIEDAEWHAVDYVDLISQYVEALEKISSVLRRR